MNRISVIVPIYNGEKYVKTCLDMLLSQKEFLYEIILVNDGSIDKTEEIIKSYLPNEKIKYIFQTNKGVSEARNVGLENASGDWIVFCDVDDEICDGFFDDVSNIVSNGQMDLVCFAGDTVGAADKQNAICDLEKKDAFLGVFGEADFPYSQDYLMMSAWSKAFRRSLLTNEGIKFDKRLSFGEDTLFMLEYIARCKRIDCIHRGYYSYIQNENSACKSGGKESDYLGFKVLVERMEELLKTDKKLNEDVCFNEAKNRFIYRMGEYSIGRYRRGTENKTSNERKSKIRDMCRIMKEYSKGNSHKKQVKNCLIKCFTGLYLKFVRR